MLDDRAHGICEEMRAAWAAVMAGRDALAERAIAAPTAATITRIKTSVTEISFMLFFLEKCIPIIFQRL